MTSLAGALETLLFFKLIFSFSPGCDFSCCGCCCSGGGVEVVSTSFLILIGSMYCFSSGVEAGNTGSGSEAGSLLDKSTLEM